jgi:hypothetical protein
MDQFTAGSCISFGWETFKKRPWFLIIVTVVIVILEGGFRYQYQTNSTPNFSLAMIVWGLGGGIVGAVIAALARMGRVTVSLKAHDAISDVGWKDLWAPHPFWRYVGGSVLTALIVIGGLILLIVPGIIFALRYMFVSYVIMDKKMRPMEALRESARITYGHKWDLFGFAILLLLLNILGFICLFVGLLVTVPLTWLAMVHAYRTLEKIAGPASAA